MAREPRGAVVSVRISEDEQARLRRMAHARGTSLSELVRSVVVREITPRTIPTATVTTSPLSRPAAIGAGVFWKPTMGATLASSGTLMVRAVT